MKELALNYIYFFLIAMLMFENIYARRVYQGFSVNDLNLLLPKSKNIIFRQKYAISLLQELSSEEADDAAFDEMIRKITDWSQTEKLDGTGLYDYSCVWSETSCAAKELLNSLSEWKYYGISYFKECSYSNKLRNNFMN